MEPRLIPNYGSMGTTQPQRSTGEEEDPIFDDTSVGDLLLSSSPDQPSAPITQVNFGTATPPPQLQPPPPRKKANTNQQPPTKESSQETEFKEVFPRAFVQAKNRNERIDVFLRKSASAVTSQTPRKNTRPEPKQPKFSVDNLMHFLTYTHTEGIPVEEFRRLVREVVYQGLSVRITSARENHAPRDGDVFAGVHDHVVIIVDEERFRTTRARRFDIEYNGKTYHPHFESVHNIQAVLRYTIKDGNYACSGKTVEGLDWDVDIYLQGTKKKAAYSKIWIVEQLKEGKTIYDLDDECPQAIFDHLPKIKNYMKFSVEKASLRRVFPPFPGFQMPDYRVVEPDWLAYYEMLNTAGHKRDFRQLQPYIWSNQYGVGKSYPVIVTLSKFFRVEVWNQRSKFQNPEVAHAQVLLFDDIDGEDEGFSVSELKALVQGGGSVKVNVKNDKDVSLNPDCLIVFTSNLSPDELFANKRFSKHKSAFMSRFKILHVEVPCHARLVGEQEPVVEGIPSNYPRSAILPRFQPLSPSENANQHAPDDIFLADVPLHLELLPPLSLERIPLGISPPTPDEEDNRNILVRSSQDLHILSAAGDLVLKDLVDAGTNNREQDQDREMEEIRRGVKRRLEFLSGDDDEEDLSEVDASYELK